MVRDIVIILIILIGGYFYIRRFYRFALLAIVFLFALFGQSRRSYRKLRIIYWKKVGRKNRTKKNSLFKNSTDFGCIFCNIVNKKQKH